MKTKLRLWINAGLVAAGWLALAAPVSAAEPAFKLRVATVAPRGSSFHQSFQNLGDQWRRGARSAACSSSNVPGALIIIGQLGVAGQHMKRRKSIYKWLGFGFGVGVVAGTIYALQFRLFEEESLILQVVFYPGRAAAFFLYDSGVHSTTICMIAGIAVMGVLTGGVACVWALIVQGLRGRQDGNPSSTCA